MRKKSKRNYFILVFIFLFCVSIGYAAISRTLTITGNSEVKQNTWDIHFDNLKVVNGSVEDIEKPTINNSNLSVNFNFMLNLPGDFYEFTVDVVNAGSIDAMIESIEKTPELTEEQKKYMNYIVEYENEEQIISKQLVSKNNGFVRLKIRVEFRRDVAEEDMPASNLTMNLGFKLNYVQADDNSISVKDNGIWLIEANGSLDDIGTIVTIGTEQFYTIGTEGNNVKLLAMYNLLVGNIVYSDTDIRPVENPTGIQNTLAKGILFNSDGSPANYPWIGISDFAESPYWADFTPLPSLVYNSNSLLYNYVENYKTYLESFNLDIEEARLISYSEVYSLGCDYGICSVQTPSWLYSTTYWTGSATDNEYGLRVFSRGSLGDNAARYKYGAGVRPVIVISKDYF